MTNDRIDGVKAKWSTVDTSAVAPAEPLVSVNTTLPRQGERPALAGGRVAAPDAPATATIWNADAIGPDDGVQLDVGDGEAAVNELAAIGDTAYALGSRWHDGLAEPFLMSSTDRETWNPFKLPTAVLERGISLSTLAGEPTGGPIVAGVDDEDKPVVIVIDRGDVITLPTPDYGRVTGVDAAASSAKTSVVLVEVEREAGGQEIVPFTSKDAGATWDPQPALPSTEPSVNGMVAVRGGFLATGYSLRGTTYLAAAWFSKDGASWSVETSLPSVPGHMSGWSTWASAPTVSGRDLYATIGDYGLLRGMVVRRAADGRWSAIGELPSWIAPGATTGVVADGRSLVGIRSWNGHLQTGTLSSSGRWRTTSESGATPDVTAWETVGQLGKDTLLVGARSEVTTTPNGGWSRSTELTPLALTGDTLEAAGWQPKQLEGATGVTAVTDDAGNALVAAQQSTGQDPSATSNAYDVVGWFKAAEGSAWKPADGLAGPRAEFVSSAANHDGEWTVIGSDRASFDSSDHAFGALWTSRDGTSWRRAKGPFDVSSTANSWLQSTCLLPGGDLLAVGGVEDADTGSRAVAFRRTKGTWKTLDTSAVGANVTNFDSCASSGDIVLLQGTAGGRDAVWSTADVKTFTSIEVGQSKDSIGTIKTIDGGFVAPGGIYSGLQQRAVVWLSSDGKNWHAVDVPADRVLTVTNVAPSSSGVVVTLTGVNGTAVRILENASELLR